MDISQIYMGHFYIKSHFAKGERYFVGQRLERMMVADIGDAEGYYPLAQGVGSGDVSHREPRQWTAAVTLW